MGRCLQSESQHGKFSNSCYSIKGLDRHVGYKASEHKNSVPEKSRNAGSSILNRKARACSVLFIHMKDTCY